MKNAKSLIYNKFVMPYDKLGLGLRLAKKVATLHTNGGLCGDVALANEPGAVFILRLPL